MPTVLCNGKNIELVINIIPEPTTCPFCGQPAGRKTNIGGESTDTFCLNVQCPEKVVQKIENWIDKNRILGIGDTILRAMVKEFGMVDPASLYELAAMPDALQKLAALKVGNTLGESNAEKILNNINACKEFTIEKFLGSVGIDRLGRRMVQIIREKVPGEMDTIGDWLSGKMLDGEFRERSGLPNVVETINASLQEARPVIERLLKYVSIVSAAPVAPVTTEGPLGGKSFCLTGTMSRKRAEIEADIVKAGGIAKDDVKKGLDYLVMADPESQSSKSVKAKKLGCKLISEQELMTMIGGG